MYSPVAIILGPNTKFPPGKGNKRDNLRMTQWNYSGSDSSDTKSEFLELRNYSRVGTCRIYAFPYCLPKFSPFQCQLGLGIAKLEWIVGIINTEANLAFTGKKERNITDWERIHDEQEIDRLIALSELTVKSDGQTDIRTNGRMEKVICRGHFAHIKY